MVCTKNPGIHGREPQCTLFDSYVVKRPVSSGPSLQWFSAWYSQISFFFLTLIEKLDHIHSFFVGRLWFGLPDIHWLIMASMVLGELANSPRRWRSWLVGGLFRNDILHRIGWWENLQESPIFDGKNHGFLWIFPLANPLTLGSKEIPMGLAFASGLFPTRWCIEDFGLVSVRRALRCLRCHPNNWA